MKERNQMTSKISASKFRFCPKNFPEIEQCVVSISWKMANNKLKLSLEETNKFDVLMWLAHVKKQHANSQKSPFADTDKDSSDLIFTNTNDSVAAKVRFKDLKLEYHKTGLYGSSFIAYGIDCPNDALHHTVVFSYASCELTTINPVVTMQGVSL
jgi:hypothetical protein